ncbi:MAG TPA: class I SAM-dependent methyltransferase, partial [Polyangia bacterium]|nr:class I SAM-dependent methyltransferase [Polyangia bacterium]
MSETNGASAWSAARGDKWRAHLAGMEATLEPIDDPLLTALELDAPYRIAEIGCGGGGTALQIVDRAPAGSVVHGFDIAPGLVEIARSRVPPDARDLVFTVADMAKTAPEQRYDRLVSRLGIMFFDEPAAAFANLAHWLVPGGRFAFAAWNKPAENPWMATVREVVAQLVDLPPPEPNAPGPFRYGDIDLLRGLLDGAGFSEVDARPWRGALTIGGGLPPAQAARFALAAFSTFADLLAQAGDAALAAAQHALTARFDEHVDGKVVKLGAAVHIVTGTVR